MSKNHHLVHREMKMKKALLLLGVVIPIVGIAQCGFDNNNDGVINHNDLLDFLVYYGSETDCEPDFTLDNWSDFPSVVDESIHAEWPYPSTYNMIIQENEPIYIDGMTCINVHSIGGKSGRDIATNEIIGSHIVVTPGGGASSWIEIYIEDNVFDFPNVHPMFQKEDNVNWGWVIINEGNPDEDVDWANVWIRDIPCYDPNCPTGH